jgi:hypothetical protein
MEKGKRAFPRSLSRKKHDKASYQQMENGQGYPETEKLLIIGNSYGVSMTIC